MTKRSIWVFTLLAVSIVGFAATGWGSEAPSCGAILASHKGVPARSNLNYPYDSCGGRSVYGLQYQCVEYVRRFYHLVKGIETREGMMEKRWGGDAGTYFKAAAGKGLDAFENGGAASPLPDDILVFRGGPYGHVAIITAVSDDHIEFIEQNLSPTGIGRLAYHSDTHRVADRVVPGGVLIVEGWLRPSSAAVSHASIP